MKKSVLFGALVVAVLLSAAAYATADSVTYTAPNGNPRTTSGTVNVSATVNPKLTLTIVTPLVSQAVDFGAVDPGVATGPQTVNLSVSSNKKYDLSKTIVGAAPIGLTTTLGASLANAETAATPFSDAYSINVPWTTAPGPYTATVQYTVTQN